MSEVIHCPDGHQTIWKALGDKDYREAFAEAHVGDFLASQIYSMRLYHGWNQGELAEKAGVTQPMISQWEKSCEGVRLGSLFKVAGAFDVGLMVKFVPFSQIAREAINARADVPVVPFDDESPEAINFSSFKLLYPEPRKTQRKRGTYLEWNKPVPATHANATTLAG